MLKVIEPPPEDVLVDLLRLRSALDEEVPAKVLDRNLLIATWNVRAFGDLTDKWESAAEDSPKRDLHSFLCIAEIVSRFDVVAVQEAKDNLKALRRLIQAPGPSWGLSLTDVTAGAPGNGERMAFLFDTRRVQLSGLACEIVVPEKQLGPIGSDALQRQFARTPYAVSFRSAQKTSTQALPKKSSTNSGSSLSLAERLSLSQDSKRMPLILRTLLCFSSSSALSLETRLSEVHNTNVLVFSGQESPLRYFETAFLISSGPNPLTRLHCYTVYSSSSAPRAYRSIPSWSCPRVP
jgi:hypothetical protein